MIIRSFSLYLDFAAKLFLFSSFELLPKLNSIPQIFLVSQYKVQTIYLFCWIKLVPFAESGPKIQ